MTIHMRKSLFSERSDQEFLPAALEILETPPAPLNTLFILVICAFVVAALTWSYFSRIDIIAVAQGKIQPTGRVKLVQPSDPGRVIAIYASNGLHVHAGQVLVELDPSESKADEDAITAEYFSAVAEITRRRTEIEDATSHKIATSAFVGWDPEIPSLIRDREDRVFAEDLTQLSATVDSLLAQIKQKSAERDRLKATIASETALIATLNERVTMRDQLARESVGSKASLIDSIETLQTQQTTLTTQIGEEKESEANIEVIGDDIVKTFDTFIADNGQKLDDAEKRTEDAKQRLIKAHVRSERMSLRSPIGGTVQALSVTTVGQVVTAGEQLMRIVPDGSQLEIECYMPNKDIGFVRVGQPAVVKLEAFPFTRYGTLKATVSEVADDSIPEPDASQIEGNPTKSNRSMFDGAERTQNLVFPVVLRPSDTRMRIDGLDVPISSGMAVSVEIRTGSRRILEYVFSPIVEVASRAFSER